VLQISGTFHDQNGSKQQNTRRHRSGVEARRLGALGGRASEASTIRGAQRQSSRRHRRPGALNGGEVEGIGDRERSTMERSEASTVGGARRRSGQMTEWPGPAGDVAAVEEAGAGKRRSDRVEADRDWVFHWR
jgi:hypothetical protein